MKENGFQIEAENEKVVCNLSNTISFKVEDNSMYPLIKENDEVTIEIKNRYINGDIVAISIKEQKGVIIRQVVLLGKNIELIPLNKDYKAKSYNKDSIIILGKVKKVITEI